MIRNPFKKKPFDPRYWDRVPPRDALDLEWRFGMKRLARYNGERGRGLIHTPETEHEMRGWQALFNDSREDPEGVYAAWRSEHCVSFDRVLD